VFTGETVSHVLAAVLRAEPDWTTLPAEIPAPIRKLLRRCLEKDRKRRLDSAADARLEVEDALAPSGDASTMSVTRTETAWPRALPWGVTGTAVAGLLLVLVLWAPWRKVPPPTASAPLRLEAALGADASLVITSITSGPAGGAAAVVSPDGTQLAFVAQPHGGGAPRLYVRHLDQLTATPLEGTEGAAAPFFSPDGQWLGFFGRGWLKKIAVTGGFPVALTPVTTERGGSWAEVEAGNVWLPNPQPHGRLLPERAWVDAFLHQLCVFPTGAHDDDVDAFSQLIARCVLPVEEGWVTW
jgi:serine/threonine-protein kinase